MVWLVVVALLWLDGRIGRYFGTAMSVAVAVGPLVGGAVGTGRVGTGTASVGWTAAFAVRLPLGVPVGSAAVLCYAVETLTVVSVSVPGVLLGAAAGARHRRHLPDATGY